jgi:hypothetical protein
MLFYLRLAVELNKALKSNFCFDWLKFFILLELILLILDHSIKLIFICNANKINEG